MEIFSKHEITPHSYVSSLLRRPLSSSSAPHHLILSILHTFLLNYKIMARLLISNLCSFFLFVKQCLTIILQHERLRFLKKNFPALFDIMEILNWISRIFWHLGKFNLDFPHFLTFGEFQFFRSYWHFRNFYLNPHFLTIWIFPHFLIRKSLFMNAI